MGNLKRETMRKCGCSTYKPICCLLEWYFEVPELIKIRTWTNQVQSGVWNEHMELSKNWNWWTSNPCISFTRIDPQMVDSWSPAFGAAYLKIIKQPLIRLFFVWSLNSNMCLIHSLPKMRKCHPNEHLYPRNGQIGQLRHVSLCLSIQIGWLGVQLYVQIWGHVSANLYFQVTSWPIENWGLPHTGAVKNGQQRLLKLKGYGEVRTFSAAFLDFSMMFLV